MLDESDFQAAQILAWKHGLNLRRCSEKHYQVIGENGWLVNLYPTTGTIYVDPKRPKPPEFTAGSDWTLADIVNQLSFKREPGDAKQPENFAGHA